MTVAELIAELEKIDDKTLEIEMSIYYESSGVGEVKVGVGEWRQDAVLLLGQSH